MRGHTVGLIVSVIVIPAMLVAGLFFGRPPDPPPIARINRIPTPASSSETSPWYWSKEYAEARTICGSVENREPPLVDRPTANERNTLRNCASERLYYGLGMKADPARARKCAFIETEKDWEYGHEGRKMLMVIYANGRGAVRNLDVAMHLACGFESASMDEVRLRVSHLNHLKQSRWTGHDFDYCDDITSGHSGGECAHHDAELAKPAREAALARLTSGWSASAKQAFAALRKAFDAFAEARRNNEVDKDGTLREAVAVVEEERLRDGFLARMQQLARGNAPSYTAAKFKAADRKLNAAYAALLGNEERMDWVGADPKLVTQTERLWLRYRDAFDAFARIKYPHMRPESIAGWLTDERTSMLNTAPAPYGPYGSDEASL